MGQQIPANLPNKLHDMMSCHVAHIWEQYALALQAGPCQANLQKSSAAAAAGDLQQADGHFNTALKTAAQMAGLRQTRPQSSQSPFVRLPLV